MDDRHDAVKHAPLAQARCRADGAPMRLYDALGNGEAEPGALAVGGRDRKLLEFHEELAEILLCYPLTRVDNAEDERIAQLFIIAPRHQEFRRVFEHGELALEILALLMHDSERSDDAPRGSEF